MYTRRADATREAPGVGGDGQPDAREGQAGRRGVAERLVVPMKPGNAGGAKGPQFKTDAASGEGPGDWATYQLRQGSETPDGVACQSEGEAGYRFYALYDKVYREDVLACA